MEAAACWRRCYIDSTELRSMCKSKDNPDGPLEKEAVEFAISMVPRGESELGNSRTRVTRRTRSPGPDSDRSGRGLLQTARLEQHVGPLEIIQFHTKQFFGGDEYVMWMHPQSQTCLGYQRYQYWHRQRPFSIKTPFPRIKRFYGLSLIERLAPDVVEIAGNRNRRNDFLDQRTLPPMYELDGAKLLTKNNAFGPDARWKLPSKDAVGILPLPTDTSMLLAGEKEEQLMRQDIEEFTGNSAPMLGAPSSGRKTAKEIQQVTARASVRHNFVAMHIRDADARTLYQIVQLKIQYGPDYAETDTQVGGKPMKLQISKEMLAQDFTWSIAGSGGPLDKSSQAQEMQSLYALLMQNPIIQPDPVKVWGVTRMLLEQYNRADILSLIGTRDEAEQQKKLTDMLKQQQMQQMMMGGGAPPAGGGGGGAPHQPAGHPAPHAGGAMTPPMPT